VTKNKMKMSCDEMSFDTSVLSTMFLNLRNVLSVTGHKSGLSVPGTRKVHL
jgi:hypothetical protein